MLVKLLRALLEAFISSKRKWIAEQATPTDSSIRYNAAVGDWQEIIPQEDGWLSIESWSTNLLILELGSNRDRVKASVSNPSGGKYFCLSLPVQKGVSQSYKISGSVPVSECRVTFHKNRGSI